MSVVTCEKVTRQFGDLVAVDNVSFQVRRGEIFGIIGPNELAIPLVEFDATLMS